MSEIVTLRIYETPASPHTVYLNGFVLLLLGAYLVSVHNIWTRRWPVLITVSAWGAVVLGVLRLFFPTAAQAPVDGATVAMLGVFAVFQMVITVQSYRKS